MWLGLVFLAAVSAASAGQIIVLPSSSTGVTLQTNNFGINAFLVGRSVSIGDPANTAVSGDNSQNWRLTNYGGIAGGTANGASGIKLGALDASMSVVRNYGSIVSNAPNIGAPAGVQFTKGGQVYNFAGGLVQGPDGAHADNGPILVENHGAIRCDHGGGSGIYGGAGVLVRNYAGALIESDHLGVNANGFSRNAYLYNYGTIQSVDSAANFYNGDTYTIFNAPSGVMTSDKDAIYLRGNDGYLLNQGLISAGINGVKSENGAGNNVYVNAGVIGAGASGLLMLDSGNTVYNFGSLSGAADAVHFSGGGNLLVLGSQAYLPRLGQWVSGPGSRLGGDAVSAIAGNHVMLTDSGSEDSALTGFESLTMIGGAWTLSAPLTLGFGVGSGSLAVQSGRLSLTGDVAAANSGAVTVANGGTLSLYRGLAAGSLDIAGGGVFEYGGNAGNFADMDITAASGGLFRLSRADSRLTLQNSASLDLRPGSLFGVTVGLDPASHSILFVDTFNPGDGALLDVNGHTLRGVGISALPAGVSLHQGVVRALAPVNIPASMRIAGNPLAAAALFRNPADPNWADLDLSIRNINDVYGPHIEAADVWRLSPLPTDGQRRWLDDIYRTGFLGGGGREFFQVLDGHTVLAVPEALRANLRHFAGAVADRLATINDPRLGDLRAALRRVGSPDALAMAANAPGEGGSRSPRYAVWVSGGSRWSRQDSRDNILGYDYDPFALTLGFERTQANWVVGLAAQYEQGKVKALTPGGEAGAETEIKAAIGGLYAAYQASRWYGRVGMQFGYARNDEDAVYRLWSQASRASYDSGLFGADAEFGLDFAFGDPQLPFRVTPHAGFAYGHVRQKAFSESGAAAVMRSFAKNGYDIAEGSAGVRLAKVFTAGGSAFVPYLDASYAYNFGDRQASGAASFSSLPGQTWRVYGVDSGRNALRCSAGLSARIRERVDLDVAYNLEWRQKFLDQGVRLGIGVEF